MLLASIKILFVASILSTLRLHSSLSLVNAIDVSHISLDSPVVTLGKFDISIGNGLLVSVSEHTTQKLLWRTFESEPFLRAAYSIVAQPPIVDGNFQCDESIQYFTNSQNITNVTFDDISISIRGYLTKEELTRAVSYQIRFWIYPDNTNQLFLNSSIHSSPGSDRESFQHSFNRLFLEYWISPNEGFYGFGESFTFMNLRGLRVPILVSEQGVGRGEQPITDYLNGQTEGTGGHWYTTYAPKAIYVTSENRSMYFGDNSQVVYVNTSVFGGEIASVEVWSTFLSGRIIYGERLVDIIGEVTAITGRMNPLPAWSQRGAVVGLEGGTANVSAIVDRMVAAGVPVVGVWLQDWVGLRHGSDGDRLIWNWELNYDWYPGWHEMISKWDEQGIRVLTYISPFFSDPTNFTSQSRHNFYQEGIDNGYFVKKSDGSPYKLFSLTIEFCMVDPTNPDAVRWLKAIIVNQLLLEANSSGWMCDFGEYLPFDATLFSGENAAEYHNKYPEAWAAIARDALVEAGYKKSPDGGQDNRVATAVSYSEDTVFFMRSAWTRSPGLIPLFWLGDQLVSWDENDGLKSAVTGALSSGLTGHSITHSDIGGYTVETSLNATTSNTLSSLQRRLRRNPADDIDADSDMYYVRSPELLKRWSEFAAFGSGLFRTHIGSSTTSLDAQVYDSDDSMAHFAEFASIYGQLYPYRLSRMEEAQQRGTPLMRPMFLHYAYDSSLSWELKEQYLFGEEFLIAPCMTEGAEEVKVYFPAQSGPWVHLWGGNIVTQTTSYSGDGVWLTVPAGIGFPTVFYLKSSQAGQSLRSFVTGKGYDSGYIWDYSEDTSDKGDKDVYWWRLLLALVAVAAGIFAICFAVRRFSSNGHTYKTSTHVYVRTSNGEYKAVSSVEELHKENNNQNSSRLDEPLYSNDSFT